MLLINRIKEQLLCLICFKTLLEGEEMDISDFFFYYYYNVLDVYLQKNNNVSIGIQIHFFKKRDTKKHLKKEHFNFFVSSEIISAEELRLGKKLFNFL